jgi:ADP-heptose:LPS heptosyltransferase
VNKILPGLFKFLFGVPRIHITDLGDPKSILIIRQHNQLGDMLAGSSLITALKDAYPDANITFLCGPQNKDALQKNAKLSKVFVFDKKRLLQADYFTDLRRVLKKNYDVCIAPSVVSISFTNNLLAAISNSKIKIGPASLDGIPNTYASFFNVPVELDWRRAPETNVAKRILDIVKPFGITTTEYSPIISYDHQDLGIAKEFLRKEGVLLGQKTIGLHVGAGKPPNRWPDEKFCELINRLNTECAPLFILTGSTADIPLINNVLANIPHVRVLTYINRSIPEVAALISLLDLFITNDTGILHVAASTRTPQVSLFGPTDPRVWAPIGDMKIYIKKSENIADISVDDVYTVSRQLLLHQ